MNRKQAKAGFFFAVVLISTLLSVPAYAGMAKDIVSFFGDVIVYPFQFLGDFFGLFF